MKRKNLKKAKILNTSEIKTEFQNIEVSIILVHPQGPINIGMIARVMKNFRFQNLVLYHPECEIGSDARKFSMHGIDILQNARIIQDTEISLKALFDEFDFVIGTSGKKTRFSNIKRITYYIDELDLSILNTSKAKIALVFGREDKGLYNEELDLCDFVVKIPVSDDYSALNLSNAVSIVLYEFFKKLRTIQKGDIIVSNRENREILFNNIIEALDHLNYSPEAGEKVVRAIKNILGRSFSSLKENNLLISLFSTIIKKSKKEIYHGMKLASDS